MKKLADNWLILERNEKTMIREVTKRDIEECVKVIRESFGTVAEEFGFTQENAPRFTAFATTTERLVSQLQEKRLMYVYEKTLSSALMNEYDKNIPLGTQKNVAIIGYYSLQIQENGECELNNLCVLPQYRHQKVGEALFHHAILQAAAAGCIKMNIGIVEENKRLRAWYENLGAKHVGTKKFDFFPFTCGYMECLIYSKESIFHDTTILKNDEIQLVLEKVTAADASKDWLPAYHFHICSLNGTVMGKCDLRIGHNEKVYYGGNIGYNILSEYRGNHYAGKACRLLFELAKKHHMDYLIITCNPDNYASRKTCEYAGGKLIEIVELPADNDMRQDGETHKCIYRFDIGL